MFAIISFAWNSASYKIMELPKRRLVKSAFVTHFLHNHILLFSQPHWMHFPQEVCCGLQYQYRQLKWLKAKQNWSVQCLSDIHYENDTLVMNVNRRHFVQPSLCYSHILLNSWTKDVWVARIGGTSPDSWRQNTNGRFKGWMTWITWSF